MKKPLKEVLRGKTKQVYSTEDPTQVILEFSDRITAGDGKKRDVLPSKGVLNCGISTKLLELLGQVDIPTHFVATIDKDKMLVRKLEMLPLEVVLRNIATGSLIKRLPMIKEKTVLKRPIAEFFLKSDEYHDPFLSKEYIALLEIATPEEIEEMIGLTKKANDVLLPFFKKIGIDLVDFKLEFGRDTDGILRIGDEINPDSMRLWDTATGRILDKDRYRKDLGQVIEHYIEVYERVTGKKFEG
ncbi:MAG: phosphoribosylaminoimidazolesuccinocarboxamide synthase [Candidatus Hodarchaeota archaeon]